MPKMMLLYVYLGLQLVHIAQCQFSCHSCPAEMNRFDFLVNDLSLPNSLKNCSIVSNQYQCGIRVDWTRTINQTQIAFVPGYEFRRESKLDDEGDGPTVKTTLLYKRISTNALEWTNTLYYTCDSNECNNRTVLEWLLKSISIRDNFHELDNFIQTNPQFNADRCFFFANTSFSCETEMNRTGCKQCALERIIKDGSTSVCANCIDDEDVENFISREVKFPLSQKSTDDFAIIQCQVDECNQEKMILLIQSKSTVEFNPFVPNQSVSMNVSWILSTLLLSFLFYV